MREQHPTGDRQHRRSAQLRGVLPLLARRARQPHLPPPALPGQQPEPGLPVVTGEPQYFLYALLFGYGCAWLDHFGFEKNKSASFKRTLYSFMGDRVMYQDIWTGEIPF